MFRYHTIRCFLADSHLDKAAVLFFNGDQRYQFFTSYCIVFQAKRESSGWETKIVRVLQRRNEELIVFLFKFLERIILDEFSFG